MNLDRALAFSKLLQDYQMIERVLRVPGKPDRWENDVEHSYSLAMLAWYVVATEKLPLDLNLVLKYALVHDLVEVYAGDTYIYSKNPEELASKHEREAAAADRLHKEFPEFSDLHELIEQYEKREDAESKFIYALDKIQPILHIYLDEGKTWKEMDITLAMAIENKTPKVAADPVIAACFEELVELLRERQEELFGSITA